MKNYKIILITLFALFISNRDVYSINPQDLVGSMVNINLDVADKLKPELVELPENISVDAADKFKLRLVKTFGKTIIDGEKKFLSPLLLSPLLGGTLWEMGTIYNFYKFLPKDDHVGKLTRNFFYEVGNYLVASMGRFSLAKILEVEAVGQIIGILLNKQINTQKEKMAKITKLIFSINAGLGKKKKISNNSQKKLIQLLTNNFFKESKYKFYPKNTVILVLQALAYIKMEKKVDIIFYYEGVAKGLELDNIEDVFNAEKYEVENPPVLNVEETEGIIENEDGSSFSPNDFNIPDYEKFLIAKIIPNHFGGFPRVISHKGFTLFGSKKAPDCMETVIRNLVNIIIFKKNKFDKSNLNKPFKNFYENTDVTKIENQKTHNDWAKLVSDLDFIPYFFISIKNEEEHKYADVPRVSGFVKVPNLEIVNSYQLEDVNVTLNNIKYSLKKITTLSGKTYILIDGSDPKLKNIVCSEIAASGFNGMISLLSKIFTNIDIDIKNTFFDENFLSNLPQILGVLGILIINPQNIEKPNIDGVFYLELKKDTYNFTFKIKQDIHGEIISVSQKTIKYNPSLKNLFDNKSLFIFTALTGSYIDLDTINQNNFFATKLKFYSLVEVIVKINLFENENEKNKLLSNIFYSFELIEKRLQGRDGLKKIESISIQSIIDITNISKQNSQGKPFESFYKTAVKIAEKTFESENIKIKNLSINLFEALAKKEQGVDIAVKIALNSERSSDSYIKSSGIDLITALVENGQDITSAIEIAKNATDSVNFNEDNVRRSGANLFRELIKRGKAITQGLNGFNELMDDYEYEFALIVLEPLLQQRDRIDDIVDTAKKKAVSTIGRSTKPSMQLPALGLFKCLVQNEFEYQDAIIAATQAMKIEYEDEDERERVDEACLKLFKALFEKGQGIKKATELNQTLNNEKLKELLDQF